jgi:ABC-type multidrug transport system fused ATPase/permease subunit
MAWKHYKLVFVFILLQMLAGGLMPLFGLYLPVLAVDLLLTGRGMQQTLLILGGFTGAYVLLQVTGSVAEQGKYPFQNTLRSVYMRLMIFKALDCDFRLMETAEGQTWYERAMGTMQGGDNAPSSQMLNATVWLVSGVISFAFLLGILVMLNPLVLAGLVVLSVLGYFIKKVPLRYEEKQWEYTGDLRKKYHYLQHAMSEVRAGKDVRIYNLPALFDRLCSHLMDLQYAVRTRIGNRYFAAGALQGVLGLVRDGLAYAYCLWRVVQGHIGITEFILYMGAIGSFYWWLDNLVNQLITLRRENKRLNDVRGFLEAADTMEPLEPLDLSVVSGRPLGVEFKNVRFRYTADTPRVLDGVSFKIHAGEKAALVGINGAGKTTVVKLLCGFYKADEGEILINGYDINRFRRVDLYGLFSAVFQDTCIVPFTTEENITLQLKEGCDAARLEKAVKIAGIHGEIAKYPKGMDTYMTKTVKEDGVVLSGGQQQKLALARALYKDAPLLVLDEPTAALDPIAESEVYEGFHEVTGGKTALFISHRLASTRFCDRILMLSGGKITENGPHEALMAQNGEYAHMFEVQSHYYNKAEVQYA